MIRVPAILNSVSMTHDKSLRLGFITNEMGLSDKIEAMSMHDSFGYLLYSPNPISESDIPKESAEDKNKTPSRRLRAALYILWKQTARSDSDFEIWYRDHMEKLIDQIKSRLDR